MASTSSGTQPDENTSSALSSSPPQAVEFDQGVIEAFMAAVCRGDAREVRAILVREKVAEKERRDKLLAGSQRGRRRGGPKQESGEEEGLPQLAASALIAFCIGNGHFCLHKAAEGGHCAVINHLLLYGHFTPTNGAVDARNDNGETPLMAAIAGGSVDAVRALQAAGASLTAADTSGFTPIHLATLKSQKLLRHLVEAGVPTNVVAAGGMGTPLHLAVMTSALDCVRYLLSLPDCDVNMSNGPEEGNTPLHTAMGVEDVDVAVVRALLAAGANPLLRNAAGQTVLHEAFERFGADVSVAAAADGGKPGQGPQQRRGPAVSDTNGSLCVANSKLLNLIFDHTLCFDVNALNGRGESIVHTAVRLGSVHRILLCKSIAHVDPDVVGGEGIGTPLRYAITLRKVDCALALIHYSHTNRIEPPPPPPPRRGKEREGAPQRRSKSSNPKAAAAAAPKVASRSGRTALKDCDKPMVIDFDGRRDTTDAAAYMPLIVLAAAKGLPSVVKALVERGCDRDATDGAEGLTALHVVASRQLDPLLCTYLVSSAECSAAIAAKETGLTPLHAAAATSGAVECVRALIRAGLYVNYRTFAGPYRLTPIEVAAAISGDIPTLDYLEQQGADRVSNDALVLAARNARWAMLTHLLLRGYDPNTMSRAGESVLEVVCGLARPPNDGDKGATDRMIASLIAKGAAISHRVVEAAAVNGQMENIMALVTLGATRTVLYAGMCKAFAVDAPRKHDLALYATALGCAPLTAAQMASLAQHGTLTGMPAPPPPVSVLSQQYKGRGGPSAVMPPCPIDGDGCSALVADAGTKTTDAARKKVTVQQHHPAVGSNLMMMPDANTPGNTARPPRAPKAKDRYIASSTTTEEARPSEFAEVHSDVVASIGAVATSTGAVPIPSPAMVEDGGDESKSPSAESTGAAEPAAEVAPAVPTTLIAVTAEEPLAAVDKSLDGAPFTAAPSPSAQQAPSAAEEEEEVEMTNAFGVHNVDDEEEEEEEEQSCIPLSAADW